MTRLSILHIFILLASTTIATDPPPKLATLKINGTELFGLEEPANGTIGIKADLAPCRDDFYNDYKLTCYVGSACLADGEGKHEKIIQLRDDEYMTMDQNATYRDRILNCDLRIVMKFEVVGGRGVWEFEYETSIDYFHLTAVMDLGKDRYIDIDRGNVICGPGCDIFETSRGFVDKPVNKYYFWAGNITTKKMTERAYLDQCHIGRMICYVGSGCLHGQSQGVHISIVNLSKKTLREMSPELKKEMEKCNVGLTLMTKKDKSGRYKLEYHTAFNNAHLVFRINEIRRNVSMNEHGLLSCTPNCEFTQNPRDEVEGNNFWFSGELAFKNPKVNVSAEFEPSGGQASKAGAKGEQDSEQSERVVPISLGSLILICLGAIVLLVILVVVVGTMIQRHQNAKNQLRREALTAAVIVKRKSSEERNKSQLDPFIPKDQTTQTCNDISDSVKSERSLKE